jgi:uncharacterized protein
MGPEGRVRFAGVSSFDYDPRYRVTASLAATDPAELDIAGNRVTRFASAELELDRLAFQLDCFWLQGYGGGLFLPFGDTTNGTSTYGGGRYLLDTAKGADLGVDDGKLVLDFNFAYNPSCAYDPRWVCPLAPPANRLPVAVEAGERVS